MVNVPKHPHLYSNFPPTTQILWFSFNDTDLVLNVSLLNMFHSNLSSVFLNLVSQNTSGILEPKIK